MTTVAGQIGLRFLKKIITRPFYKAPNIWKGQLLAIIGFVRTGDSMRFGDFDLNLLGLFGVELGVLLGRLPGGR